MSEMPKEIWCDDSRMNRRVFLEKEIECFGGEGTKYIRADLAHNPPPVSGWNFDMSKAPRDGRKILLYWPYWKVEHAVVGNFFDGGWESADANVHYHEGMFPDRNPTAWQPLPAPPVSSEKGES